MAEINYQLPPVTIYGEKPSLWNNILRGFRNATLGAAMADTPSVMTASGWRLNEKGDYVQDKQDDEGVSRLRENLADISMMSPTHPVTAVVDKTLPYVIKGGNYLWNQGLIQAGKRGNLWAVNKAVSNAFNKAYKGTYNILEPLSTTIVSGSRPIQVGESYIRINPTWTWANEAIDVYPKGKPNQFFLLIKDNKSPGLTPNPNGEYSVHFKTTRTGITPQEKEGMFKALEEQIPEGAKVSTWGTLTPGGYHGVNRFGNLFGYPRVGTRQADIPIYLKSLSKFNIIDDIINAPKNVSKGPDLSKLPKSPKVLDTTVMAPEVKEYFTESSPYDEIFYSGRDHATVIGEYQNPLTLLYYDNIVKPLLNDHNNILINPIKVLRFKELPRWAGLHRLNTHESFVGQNIPEIKSTLIHEEVGHGTDLYVNPEDYRYLFFEGSLNPYEYQTYLPQELDLKARTAAAVVPWYEQRATFEEARSELYEKACNQLGKTLNLKEFNEYIDNLSDLDIYKSMYVNSKNLFRNGYASRMARPFKEPMDIFLEQTIPPKGLVSKYRTLYKTLPMIGIPTLFGGTYLKNQNNDRQ